MTIDLNAIRKRAEAATEGPWSAEYSAVVSDHANSEGLAGPINDVCVLSDGEYIDNYNQRADANFIANARQDVPALIAEVERLRTQQARLIAELEKADKFSDELRAELFRQQLPGFRKLAENYVKEERE